MKQFKWRLFLTYLAVILVIFAAAQLYASFVFKETLIAGVSSNLESKTYLIKTVLEKYPRPVLHAYEIDSMVKDMGRTIQPRITVIGLDGVVIGDSEVPQKNIRAMENHAHRPEFAEALKTGFATSIRFSTTLKKKLIYSAALSRKDGLPAYVVRLALPLDNVEEKVATTKRYFSVAAAVGLILAFFLNLVIAHGLSRPLGEMTFAARKMAEGDFEYRIRRIPQGELGVLAEALNSLSSQVKTKIAEITSEKGKNEAILKGISSGIMAVDKEGRIILLNQALRDSFAIDQDFSDRPPVEVIRSIPLQEAFTIVLKERAPQRLEIPVAYPRERVFDVRIVPLFAADTIQGAIAVFHDVTDIRQLAQIRKDFVTNVSHELKNPLTAIKGYAETLLDGGIDDREKAQSFIRIISEHANRMDNLIQDILALARLEAQGTGITNEQVSVKEVVEGSLRALGPQAEMKRIKFAREFPPEDIMVWGDHEKLSQAVLNIVDNAVKYSPSDTRITVSLSEREGEAQIDIRDEGTGIPKEDQERIFERFYRVDKGRSRAVGGTGLGLSIVKHAILAHKGRVWVESEPSEGSTFHIVLPKHST
ncbi:MAG: two-component system histidine kinase PnpS [Thermodesulfobacteriota bacterium]